VIGYAAGHASGIESWITMLGTVLLIVGVVVLVAWLLRRGAPDSQATAARAFRRDPVEVVRMRFARGELSRDEYLAALATLGADR
jgi:uncharacterized membrane protein